MLFVENLFYLVVFLFLYVLVKGIKIVLEFVDVVVQVVYADVNLTDALLTVLFCFCPVVLELGYDIFI